MNQLELVKRILHQIDMRFTLLQMSQDFNRLGNDINNIESQSNEGMFLAGHTLIEAKKTDINNQIRIMTEDREDLQKILGNEMKELLKTADELTNLKVK